VDIGDIWAEAEFYFQQGLFDEAKKHYAKIIEVAPGEKRAIDRLGEITREEEETREFSKLADAVEELEEAAPSVVAAADEQPLSSSDEEAVRSLMQQISDLKRQPDAPPSIPTSAEPFRSPKRPAAPVFEPAEPAAAERSLEDEFFDLGEELKKDTRQPAGKAAESSDDFFDLAAELRDELSGATVPARPSGQAEEQSLDEIFEEFKRGVEKQTVKEDVDTHYNLGVAYKEMGLLDDAVSEFIMTPEDEPKYFQSRYMLGLCYMEKGEYQNAAVEIQNALSYMEVQGIDDDETGLSMHYDLGLAYQGAGNINSAISEFQIVHALDSGYRDIATKLKELQQGDFISLDQLKDDIEREISSKFLVEGERIEREEKTRKNERVRN
jgi:tetratricopeptide (TPR) repeat protein